MLFRYINYTLFENINQQIPKLQPVDYNRLWAIIVKNVTVGSYFVILGNWQRKSSVSTPISRRKIDIFKSFLPDRFRAISYKAKKSRYGNP